MPSLKQMCVWLFVGLTLFSASSRADTAILVPDTVEFSDKDLDEMAKCVSRQSHDVYVSHAKLPPTDPLIVKPTSTTSDIFVPSQNNPSRTESEPFEELHSDIETAIPLHQIISPSHALLFVAVFLCLYFCSAVFALPRSSRVDTAKSIYGHSPMSPLLH